MSNVASILFGVGSAARSFNKLFLVVVLGCLGFSPVSRGEKHHSSNLLVGQTRAFLKKLRHLQSRRRRRTLDAGRRRRETATAAKQKGLGGRRHRRSSTSSNSRRPNPLDHTAKPAGSQIGLARGHHRPQALRLAHGSSAPRLGLFVARSQRRHRGRVLWARPRRCRRQRVDRRRRALLRLGHGRGRMRASATAAAAR